jgi:exportin-2 (importin alpha re-exporter)
MQEKDEILNNKSSLHYLIILAEDLLKSLEKQPGASIFVLQLLQRTDIDLPTRLAAAVFFKNLVKNNWAQVRLFFFIYLFIVFVFICYFLLFYFITKRNDNTQL